MSKIIRKAFATGLLMPLTSLLDSLNGPVCYRDVRRQVAVRKRRASPQFRDLIVTFSDLRKACTSTTSGNGKPAKS